MCAGKGRGNFKLEIIDSATHFDKSIKLINIVFQVLGMMVKKDYDNHQRPLVQYVLLS